MNKLYHLDRENIEFNKNMLIALEMMKILLPDIHIEIEVWITLVCYLPRKILNSAHIID